MQQEPKNICWQTDLAAYVSCHDATDQRTAQLRAGLLDAVTADPRDPTSWQRFLAHEEAAQIRPSSAHARQQPQISQISLYHLYFWATQLVPRQCNHQKEEYLLLWLGFARHQWCALAHTRGDSAYAHPYCHTGIYWLCWGPCWGP